MSFIEGTNDVNLGNFVLQVDYYGTVNLVDACRKVGVSRFILVSSILVNGAAMGQLLNPAYIVLNAFGLVLVAKLQAEQYIRKSGINFTIIRPGGLKNDPPSGNIVMEPEVYLLCTLCTFSNFWSRKTLTFLVNWSVFKFKK